MSTASHARPPATPSLQVIQAPIRGGLERVSGELVRICVEEFPLLRDVTQHLLLMKGKMFRPTLALLASEIEESPEPRVATLAAIVELVHLATLVHDDSVDHSVLRRGMPTLNALFSHQVSVITGDFLYSRAVVELARGRHFDVIGVLAEATNHMTVGEIRQLTALDALAFSEQDYDALIEAKTASLLAAACEIGALAGAPAYRDSLARYGTLLGMAFQVTDDLLDYTADEAVTGKPSGSDLREHKVTLPLIHALRTISAASRREVEALFADPEPDDRRIDRVVGIVSEAGGLDYARRRSEHFAAEAEGAIDGLPDTPAASALRDAITYVIDRSH